VIYKLLLIAIIITFGSCISNRQKILFKQIKKLEYSRNDSSGAFDQYIEEGNQDVNIRVLDAMAKIQNPAHLPSLHKMLSEADTRIMDKIIFALGQIHVNDSAEILMKLFNERRYKLYQRQIITALGRTGVKPALNFLMENLSHLPDSLLNSAITSLCFLSHPDSIDENLIIQISDLLKHPSEPVSHAAAYFFSRHPQFYPVEKLICCRFDEKSPGYKYRLRALNRILAKDGIHRIPLFRLDSLKAELQISFAAKEIPWQSSLYGLSLLSYFPDSISVTILSGYLKDPLPHVRLAAIHALGKMNTAQSKAILLANYDLAGWSDKGETLLTLAGAQPQVINFIIQQNLDKGPLHFKQLLLQALVKTVSPAAFQQVRQFLTVPDRRLVYTAFTELAQHNQLQPRDVIPVLQSGDLALVASAAEWVSNHPQSCTPLDLENAYYKLSEPSDAEAMIYVLKAYAAVTADQGKDITFLTKVAANAASSALADQAINLLKKAGENYSGIRVKENLFLADEELKPDHYLQVLIRTSKGNIEIELWPDLAPATVANFLHLIRKGFYNNIIFHRVVSDFVIQGGDPRGDGWGGPGYSIPCEYNETEFIRGTVGMATAGKDTGGSQFFICHSEQPHLTGKYTAFGRVQAGMEVVDAIEIEDIISEITIKL